MSENKIRISAVLDGVATRLAAIQREMQERLAQIDWNAVEARLERLSDEAVRLGEAGWTMPIWATPAEVADILEEARNRPIDHVFENYFSLEDGLFFDQLKRSLLGNDRLVRWRPLIEECFWAYESDRFRIVVPAMITVLEGAIITAGGVHSARQKDPKQTTKRLAAKSQGKWFQRAVWTSVDAFVSRLFDSASFSEDQPPHLNRSWILHGRAEPNWTRADCLRLFQAADTVGS